MTVQNFATAAALQQQQLGPLFKSRSPLWSLNRLGFTESVYSEIAIMEHAQ